LYIQISAQAADAHSRYAANENGSDNRCRAI
jgi:hypothetical protein